MRTIKGVVVVRISTRKWNDTLQEYCELCIREKKWSHESGATYRR